MLSVLIPVAALALIGLALIALSFLVSSVWEREAKATTFAALQSAAMLILVLVFFFLLWGGFFETAVGTISLIAGIAARHVGADLVGVTELDPRWTYSHRGMPLPLAGEEWGAEIEVAHRYAIVFAQEMSREMIGPAPHTPSSVESMHRYVDGAVIANQVAGYVANLGYSATANHLSRYDCLLVPLAVDAGMGDGKRPRPKDPPAWAGFRR
jgi:hypothetical protein